MISVSASAFDANLIKRLLELHGRHNTIRLALYANELPFFSPCYSKSFDNKCDD